MNELSKMSNSYLELILGPMFSGKTSKLLEIYKQCNFCNISTMVINYSDDERYSETKLSTHDKQMIDCIKSTKLFDINKNIEYKTIFDECEVILINEGQFFPDIVEWCIDAVEKYNKRLYICGLDGDFERKPFGNILKLIPYCDKITKLTSLCSICKNGNAGIFSHRISDEKEQKVIGSDNYIPLCRKCYMKNSCV